VCSASVSDELPHEIKQCEADHRGRVNLGPVYRNETVRVAVVEVVEDG